MYKAGQIILNDQGRAESHKGPQMPLDQCLVREEAVQSWWRG